MHALVVQPELVRRHVDGPGPGKAQALHGRVRALRERRDVIVVSSVSCIYGLGEPDDFANLVVSLRVGAEWDRDELLRRLIEIRYERNDIAFERNMFRVRGDTVELWPAYYKDTAIRVEFFGDEVDRISEMNPLTGERKNVIKHVAIFPASHYIVSADKKAAAIERSAPSATSR